MRARVDVVSVFKPSQSKGPQSCISRTPEDKVAWTKKMTSSEHALVLREESKM